MFQQAFDNFMSSAFEAAVDSSTTASWGGGAYAVELFEDGTYRTMHKGSLGNLYDTDGLLLTIPSLSDEDWDDDPSIRHYGNAEDEIREWFEDAMSERI
jgi:hypothetical protein